VHFQLQNTEKLEISNAKLLELIQNNNYKRESLEAVLELHGGGFSKLLGSSTVDAIAERPNKLLLSFRTFFETPGLVISSDGQDLFYFRILESGKSEFQRNSLNSNKIKKLLPSFLDPDFFIDLLLGRVELNRNKFKFMSARKIRRSNLVNLEFENKNKKLILDFDLTQKVIKGFKIFDSDQNLISSAKYSNFKEFKNELNSVNFAQNIDAQVLFENKLIRLKIAIDDPVLNKNYDTETFRIQNN